MPRESGVWEGLFLYNAMHIRAGVFVNDDGERLHEDFKRWPEKLAPERPRATIVTRQVGHAGVHLSGPSRAGSGRCGDGRKT